MGAHRRPKRLAFIEAEAKLGRRAHTRVHRRPKRLALIEAKASSQLPLFVTTIASQKSWPLLK